MKRRTFIQSGTLAIVGAGCSSELFAKDSKYKNKVGLQLYSLRDVIFKDPKAVLKSVAEIGYKELETFGHDDGKVFGLPVSEYRNHVASLGLKTVSGHYNLAIVERNWEKTCDEAKTLGQTYVTIPWLDKDNYKTLADLKKTCETINKAAEVANTKGLKTAYHNHAFEFNHLEGQTIYDVMLAELDPNLVSFEMDIFWVVNAGRDPLEYFAKYPARFEQWHVKDMDKANKDRNADVGTGSIDFVKIFAAAKRSGMKHFYIEQETYPISSTDSIKASINNLLRLV